MKTTIQKKAQQLWFTAPHSVEVREQLLPVPSTNQLLIRTHCSAVSAGTEMLVYRGEVPADMVMDTTIDSLKGQLTYPMQYGYACVGRVEEIGENVEKNWLGKLVFAFHPHASHFIASVDNVIPVPDDIDPEVAVFLANMETAVNLVQDGHPGIGEQVVVLGQGVVGLLLSSLLTQFPLAKLVAVDGTEARRSRATELGVHQVCNPSLQADIQKLKQILSENNSGADLIYEVSGAPDALNLAIEVSGFCSRIVIGSWYGNKTSTVALGGDAHRNRLNIITSQVSSIAPELTGRWNKERRFDLAWDMLRKIGPQKFITHKVELSNATTLYNQLHLSSEDVVQAIFVYN